MAGKWTLGVPVPGVWTRPYASGKSANVETRSDGLYVVILKPNGREARSQGPYGDIWVAKGEAERLVRGVR